MIVRAGGEQRLATQRTHLKKAAQVTPCSRLDATVRARQTRVRRGADLGQRAGFAAITDTDTVIALSLEKGDGAAIMRAGRRAQDESAIAQRLHNGLPRRLGGVPRLGLGQGRIELIQRRAHKQPARFIRIAQGLQ